MDSRVLSDWLAIFILLIVVSVSCVRTEPPPPLLVGNPLGFRRMQTPELAAGRVRVGEAFHMYADGLTAIELRPVKVGPPHGMIRLQIGFDVGGQVPAARILEVPAADFVRGETYRFAFTPFGNSKNQHFVLEVEATADDPPSGVALWATNGVGNAEDALLFNGEGRFGDLVYQTEIVPPPPVPARHPVRPVVWYALGTLVLGWTLTVRLLRRVRATVS